ncbi:MAG: GMC oxidoreductase [Gemmobacter sp.]|nr:GMC oxidoreductase [Gemmobacter sp.]
MGHDEKHSVLRTKTIKFGGRNVFVTDGAAMTSASCVNPSLTYMALTARAAEFAVNRALEEAKFVRNKQKVFESLFLCNHNHKKSPN